MTRIPLQGKKDLEDSRVTTQVDCLSDSLVSHALIAVAQEVAELLRQAYLAQVDSINHTETIASHIVEPEYRQVIDDGECLSSFAPSPTSTADQ